MTTDLIGSTALITGATSGIGNPSARCAKESGPSRSNNSTRPPNGPPSHARRCSGLTPSVASAPCRPAGTCAAARQVDPSGSRSSAASVPASSILTGSRLIAGEPITCATSSVAGW